MIDHADDEMSTPAPEVSAGEAEAIAARYFAVKGQAKTLGSERDRNFHLTASDGKAYVLKMANPSEPREVTNFQTELLRHIARENPDLPVPRVVEATSGASELRLAIGGEAPMVVRLLTYLDGEPLHRTRATREQMRSLGRHLALLDQALSGFAHPAAERDLIWDISHADRVRPMLEHIPDYSRRLIAEHALDRFDENVVPLQHELRRQVIHNDLNPHNVLTLSADHDQLAGIIDFGDALVAPLVNDLATALSYQIVDSTSPLERIIQFAAAYHGVLPLEEAEAEILFDLIAARMVLSVAITHWRAGQYPDNRDYILRNNARAWMGLERLSSLDPGAGRRELQRACRGR